MQMENIFDALPTGPFMSLAAPEPDPLVYRFPLLGGIAREWAEGDPDFPFYLIVALLSAWACAVMIWGLPALVLPALVATPSMLVVIVLLSRG